MYEPDMGFMSGGEKKRGMYKMTAIMLNPAQIPACKATPGKHQDCKH